MLVKLLSFSGVVVYFYLFCVIWLSFPSLAREDFGNIYKRRASCRAPSPNSSLQGKIQVCLIMSSCLPLTVCLVIMPDIATQTEPNIELHSTLLQKNYNCSLNPTKNPDPTTCPKATVKKRKRFDELVGSTKKTRNAGLDTVEFERLSFQQLKHRLEIHLFKPSGYWFWMHKALEEELQQMKKLASHVDPVKAKAKLDGMLQTLGLGWRR